MATKPISLADLNREIDLLHKSPVALGNIAVQAAIADFRFDIRNLVGAIYDLHAPDQPITDENLLRQIRHHARLFHARLTALLQKPDNFSAAA